MLFTVGCKSNSNVLLIVSVFALVGSGTALPGCAGRVDGSPCTDDITCGNFGGCIDGFADSKCESDKCLPVANGACFGKAEGDFCGNCHTCKTYGSGFCYNLGTGKLECAKASAKADLKNTAQCGNNLGASCQYEEAIYAGSSSGAAPIIEAVPSKCMAGHAGCPPAVLAACAGKSEGSACDDYEVKSYGCHKGKCTQRHYSYSGGKCWLTSGGPLSCSDASATSLLVSGTQHERLCSSAWVLLGVVASLALSP